MSAAFLSELKCEPIAILASKLFIIEDAFLVKTHSVFKQIASFRDRYLWNAGMREVCFL